MKQWETPWNSEKHYETPENSEKQCETVWNSAQTVTDMFVVWFKAVVKNIGHFYLNINQLDQNYFTIN